jgi:hypothetical protein
MEEQKEQQEYQEYQTGRTQGHVPLFHQFLLFLRNEGANVGGKAG